MFSLKEALDAIKDKPEFVVRERDYGYNIDYNVAFAETFKGSDPRQTVILQNLRGTCFNKEGKITRLCFHKFHNLNENEEYHESKFDFSMSHTIEEKLDGSMIAPVVFENGDWKLGTRAGITDVGDKAQALLDLWKNEKPQKWEAYTRLISKSVANNCTPMFEFCSREQRIVIDYFEPMLVLTGIRSNESGEYAIVNRQSISNPRIDLVRVQKLGKFNIVDLAALVKTWVGREGVVVKFYDDRFVKIKAEDYVLKHKALDGLRFEKDVLKLILTGLIDDILPLVTQDVKWRIEHYRESVHARLEYAQGEMMETFGRHRNSSSKKEFAEMIVNSPYRNGLFKLWDGKEYFLKDFVLTKCGSQTDLESIRWLVGKSYLEF